jgi:hypothetical protein
MDMTKGFDKMNKKLIGEIQYAYLNTFSESYKKRQSKLQQNFQNFSSEFTPE